MPNSTPDQKADHRAEAERWLLPTKNPLPGQRDREIALAQVHSNRAIAEELKGIREELGFGLGDGSNVDHIAQALRAIAEPEKYGIDPRTIPSGRQS
jgi:hypothetical protein